MSAPKLRTRLLAVVSAAALCATTAVTGVAAASPAPEPSVSQSVGENIRFAQFNASLNRAQPGQLLQDLRTGDNQQARNVAEIIQRARPDVVLINEFDYEPGGRAAKLFRKNYLQVSQNGAGTVEYPYFYVAPVNTGVPTGLDLDNDGKIGGGNDAFGYGDFPGQYGMVVYSRFPIDHAEVRTFANFLWRDMPGNLMPTDFYSPTAQSVLRLSSKSHWDLPITIGTGKNAQKVHFLVSHPTPPTFDGPEDRNGRRNHDEIRFWADYISSSLSSNYIYDDRGRYGGLAPRAKFVIAGDQNADPYDGDSVLGAIQALLDHPKVNTSRTPTSLGAEEQANRQGSPNDQHLGEVREDTADFTEPPGNLRVDYVLPSRNLKITDAAVFWPVSTDPLFRLVGNYPFPASDHRLVWVDVQTPKG